jgi:putative FmdB family regulatory protein
MLPKRPPLALSRAECQRRYTEHVPIYEYRCENGHLFDVMQRMSDDPLTACIDCGAPVQKVLNAPAIHFKGSGFYNTDYGRKNGSKGTEGGTEGKSGDTAGSTGTGSSGTDSSTSSSSSSASSGSGSSGSSSSAKSD